MKEFLIDLFLWGLTILSLLAVILNIYKKKICFFIWIFTNLMWMFIDFNKGLYEQALLFFVYFILTIYGIYKWSKEE